MTRVYVANHANLPYEKAERFGELSFITRGYVKFTDIPTLSYEVSSKLLFSSVDDYLILSGNNLICAMVFHLWLAKHNRVKVLHWDTKTEDYIEVTLTNSNYPILR